MLFQGALFDLDGVIVDTAKYHFLAWKRLADEYGFEFTEEDNERLKGVSRMGSLDILLAIGGIELSDEEKLRQAKRKNDWYVDYINKLEDNEILSGAREYLTYLRKNGVKVALGSASKNAPLILDRLGLIELFDAIVDGSSVSQAKPDPEVFLVGAKLLGLKPENCVVFEDAEAGVEAALTGGMKCVGIGDEKTLGKANIVIAGLYEAEEKIGLGKNVFRGISAASFD